MAEIILGPATVVVAQDGNRFRGDGDVTVVTDEVDGSKTLTVVFPPAEFKEVTINKPFLRQWVSQEVVNSSIADVRKHAPTALAKMIPLGAVYDQSLAYVNSLLDRATIRTVVDFTPDP